MFDDRCFNCCLRKNNGMIKKILLVFGTRPEAIKMAPLVKEFQKNEKDFETIVCVTGQHREMLDQVLSLFQIMPDYDLNIMKSGQDLYDVTSRVLTGMRDVLKETNPDVVFVHGDTTTSMAAAMAAFYQQIPVGHIEAGLRTHNIYSPWPEDMNRQITGRSSSYNFSPTELSKNNLLKENVSGNSIFVTGNTVIDALHWVIDKINSDHSLRNQISMTLLKNGLPEHLVNSFIPKFETQHSKLILVTGHRRENFGKGFENICNSIDELTQKYPEVNFVYPMHLNPVVRNAVAAVFKDREPENLFLIEPLDYLPFVYLMEKSTIVLTDSGGIQEEAPGLGKPVLVMRDTTERPEAVDAGTVKLVGTDKNKIISEVSRLLDDQDYYDEMAKAVNPYGDGLASKRIVEIMKNKL